MVGRKKKTKICDKMSHEEDRISQLPDDLICDILYHLSTKDAVRTSVLSTKWRNLWQWVPGLDLDSDTFSNRDAFVSFAQRFFDSHRESLIHKLRLSMDYPYCKSDYLTSWIDAVTTRRIQHLDVHFNGFPSCGIPTLSIYACKTLVHLLLFRAGLASAEFVSLPCLKIIHLEYVRYPNETMLHKLISGSLVLEDLTIIRSRNDKYKKNVLQVCSLMLKRIHINEYTQVVIDAPLLQSLKTKLTLTKNFQIINSTFPARLDIDSHLRGTAGSNESVVRDILTGISRVRDLVISSTTWKEIFQYSKSGRVPKGHIRIFQFRNLSHLNAGVYTYNMDTLPILLKSCPKLESLILELVKDLFTRYNNREPKNVMFSTVPRCLVSSLKFVELKRSFSGYERELELVRYFLNSSSILEKFRLVTYDMKKSKFAFLQKLLRNMPRCSSACELVVQHCV